MSKVASHLANVSNKLPHSIILDVFMLAYHNHHLPWPANAKGYSLVPRTLASVCRQWRTIALSTSRLWSAVDLSLSYDHVVTHLERSWVLPVDMSLFAASDWDDTKAKKFRKLLAKIGEPQHWDRIRNIAIQLVQEGRDPPGPTRFVVNLLNSMINANPPKTLEFISICRTDSYHFFEGDPSNEGICLHVPHFPALREIRLTQVGLSRSLLNPPVNPLVHLQRLELVYSLVGVVDVLLPLLNIMPKLTSLSLIACNIWRDVYNPLSRGSTTIYPKHSILLANLETLCMRRINLIPRGLHILLDTLDMPGLRSFELSGAIDDDFDRLDWDSVCRSRSLEELTLKKLGPFNMAALLPHIVRLDRLETFTLFSYAEPDIISLLSGSEPTVPPDFTRDFALELAAGAYCPALRKFDICHSVDEDLKKTLKTLEANRSGLEICTP